MVVPLYSLLFFFVKLSRNEQAYMWRLESGTDAVDVAGVYGVKNVFDIANQPGSRKGASSWYYSSSTYLFGGMGFGDSITRGLLSDFWEYSSVERKWRFKNGHTTVNNIGNSGLIPGGRHGAAGHSYFCYEKDRCRGVILGGYGYGTTGTSSGYLNDMWLLDYRDHQFDRTEFLSTINPSGSGYSSRYIPCSQNHWGGRRDHFITTRGNYMYVFHGYGVEDNSGVIGYLNDVWGVDFNPDYDGDDDGRRCGEPTWLCSFRKGSRNINAYGVHSSIFSTTVTPGARAGAMYWQYTDTLVYIFGGFGCGVSGACVGNVLSDLWVYDISKNQYKVESEGTISGQYLDFATYGPNYKPMALGASTGTKNSNQELVLMCGMSFSVASFDTVWIYSPTLKQWRVDRKSDPNSVPVLGDYTFSYSHSMGGVSGAVTVWGQNGEVFMFGGEGRTSGATSGLLNTMWEMQLGTYYPTIRCNGIAFDDPNTCSARGNCVDYDTCECTAGYSGSNCEDYSCDGIVHTDLSSVCSSHGTCSDFDVCDCDLHYSGQFCNEWTCNSILWSNSQVCSSHGSCVAFENCLCDTGFTGSFCDGCPDGYTGASCNTPLCYGTPSTDSIRVCSGHGSCTAPNTCVCAVNYNTQPDCSEWFCNGVAASISTVCSSHGTCTEFNTCVCSSGEYGGADCDEWTCDGIGWSSPTVCSAHGVCKAPNLCECQDGYSADYCSHFTCYGLPSTHGDVCYGHGSCEATDSCSCDSENYYGSNCEVWKCNNIERTDPAVCANSKGLCVDHDDCRCTGGQDMISTNFCQEWNCFGVSYDHSGVCNTRGDCLDEDRCTCQKPYYGNKCMERISDGLVRENKEFRIEYVMPASIVSHFEDEFSCLNIISPEHHLMVGDASMCSWLMKPKQDEEEEVAHLYGTLDETSTLKKGDEMNVRLQTLHSVATVQFYKWNKKAEAKFDGRQVAVAASLFGVICIILTIACSAMVVLIAVLLKRRKKGKMEKEVELLGDLTRTDEPNITAGGGRGRGRRSPKRSSSQYSGLSSSSSVVSDSERKLLEEHGFGSKDSAVISQVPQSIINLKRDAKKAPRVTLSDQQLEKAYVIDVEELDIIARCGGSNAVFEASWNQQRVAVKIINTDSVMEYDKEVFEKELAFITAFKHRNIVNCLGFFIVPPKYGFVMEWANMNIREYYYQNKETFFSFPEKIRVCLEIVAALQYIHSEKVIHRDIKADNCMIFEDKSIKLIDFGGSRRTSSNSLSLYTKNVGSRHYMSPEMYRGEEYTYSTDVFSLSILFFEIFEQTFDPYSHVNEMAESIQCQVATKGLRPVFSKMMKKKKSMLVKLVEEMWQKDPNKRPNLDSIANVLQMQAK